MTCEKVKELLPAYQDNELSAENENVVKIHLDGCEDCRKEAHLLSASWELLGGLIPIEPSPDFEARFWARVRKEETRQAGWRSWLEWPALKPAALGLAGLAAVWVIGVAGGVLMFHNNHLIEATPLNNASVLTSPYPPNSIEQHFMEGTTMMKENRL